MRYLNLLLIASIPFSSHADEQSTIDDRIEFDSLGQRVVIRTSPWAGLKGTTVNVEQKLYVNEDGNLHYNYHQQSTSTQLFHQTLCAEDGMLPAMGGETVFIGSTTGWHCSRVVEYDPDAPPLQTESSLNPVKSVDYVFTNAPSGSAAVGVNFYSTGSARFQSSQAGSLRGSVQVDGRCSTYFSQYYGTPFTGDHSARVVCIVHQPRFVSTGAEACVPKQCGRSTGTISVR